MGDAEIQHPQAPLSLWRQRVGWRPPYRSTPLVENWVSPEAEPVDEFLQVLEDLFWYDEVWPQPYDILHGSLRGRRSVGKNLTLTPTLNGHSNLTQNQPLSWKSWSLCQLTRW